MIPRLGYSLRFFLVYFLIIGGLAWFIVSKALDTLGSSVSQSAEEVLVDTANLLAELVGQPADRPGQAQFVDPEGRSPQRQCFEQAKTNAVTIGFLLAFTVGLDLQNGTLTGCQHHDAHDALAIDGLAIPGDVDVAGEGRGHRVGVVRSARRRRSRSRP